MECSLLIYENGALESTADRVVSHDALIQQHTQLKPAEGLLYPGSQHNVGLWLSGSHPAKRDGGGAQDTVRNSIVSV